MVHEMAAEPRGPAGEAAQRLPWALAAPLIGGLSAGLWLVLWGVVQLALAG